VDSSNVDMADGSSIIQVAPSAITGFAIISGCRKSLLIPLNRFSVREPLLCRFRAVRAESKVSLSKPV
jgi:hypothetical protein